MRHEPAGPPALKPRRQFRLWHFAVLVAILAPILAVARNLEALRVIVVLTVLFGPAFVIASFFRRHVNHSAQSKGLDVDAFNEFISTFFVTLIAMGIYWTVLIALRLKFLD